MQPFFQSSHQLKKSLKLNIMRTFCLAALIAFLTFSCTKEKCDIRDLTYQYVEKGNLYGNGDEGISASNLVIRTQSDWDDLVSKMDSYNEVSNDFENVPINFEEQMVIACFDKVRSSGGYTIDITETDVVNNKLEVTVEKGGPGEMATTVITQPFVIVVMEKCDSEVKFND